MKNKPVHASSDAGLIYKMRSYHDAEAAIFCCLLCGGFHPVAELIHDMDPNMVTERGFVKVNAQLQFEGARYGKMFALGDVCNNPSPEMAFTAGDQGKFLARDLTAIIRKKQSGFPNPFPVAPIDAMVLPLGLYGGVSQLPMFEGIVLGDWVTRTIKSKDFFASHTWASVGATVPN
ncbi:unnamed protein product [Phytophthora lilii]|uniref:Unnamed protein product n=1 Tax=Phytophthora lilii TaxID=2077276 RepID=A0A9W6WM66_9STRA|nr:unnamed protein product [Phytophthora lilii]